MAGDRPPIPRPLAREVRQRCGFGCVVCGMPLYEYEHMLGWAGVWRHDAGEITLLCDRHHREKTVGLLPEARVREANEAPFNLRSDETPPYNLWYEGDRYEFDVGTNRVMGDLPAAGVAVQAVRMDGVPVLGARLEDGHFLLNLDVVDELGKTIVKVEDNELVLSQAAWDIELIGRRLLVREEHRKLLVDVEFLVPSTVKVRRGRFLRNGIELLVTERWAAVLNSCMLLSGFACYGGLAGLVLGNDPVPLAAAFRFAGIQRDGWDRRASIRWAQAEAAKAAVLPLEEIDGMEEAEPDGVSERVGPGSNGKR